MVYHFIYNFTNVKKKKKKKKEKKKYKMNILGLKSLHVMSKIFWNILIPKSPKSLGKKKRFINVKSILPFWQDSLLKSPKHSHKI